MQTIQHDQTVASLRRELYALRAQPSLEEEIAELRASDKVDAELAALKARLGNRGTDQEG